MTLERAHAKDNLSTPLVLFGLPFDNLSIEEAVVRIDAYIQSGVPRIVFTANVAMLLYWRKSPWLQRVYRDTDLLTIDGMALVYASHLLGKPARGSVSGSALFFKIMSLAQANAYRVFLLGADAETVLAVRRRLESIYYPLDIVGAHDGYFGREHGAAIADLVREARPHILLLGMSSPLKEDFAWTYRDRMQVPFILGVGGMFDIISGRYRLAPCCVRLLCLEWLWRLIQEPRRLGRRYAATNFVFLFLLARELLMIWIAAPTRLLAGRLIRWLAA